jgi:hypothetical protein
MLCCAFAAFILSQIVFAFDSVRERVFGASFAAGSSARAHGAAAWRLGDPAPVAARRAPRARGLAAAFALSLLVSAAAWAASLRAPASSPIHALHPSAWCSTALVASAEQGDRP